jgi:hypothetical protein
MGLSRIRTDQTIALALLLLLAAFAARADTSPDAWNFTVTPYVWVPGIDASFRIPPAAEVADPIFPVSKRNVINALDFVAMVSFEARKDRWSLYSDAFYVGLSFDRTAPTPLVIKGKLDNKTAVLELAGAYQVWRSDSSTSHFDILAGMRYAGIHNDITLILESREFKFPSHKDFPDAIIGFKGEARFGDDGRLFIPYYADVGGGSSEHSSITSAGIGYTYGWGDLALHYRYLEYQPGNNSTFNTFKLYGPMLTASFHF